jgi:hypothetical protein
VIITNPDAPVNIVEDITERALNSVAFTWEQGASNGGSVVFDFNIYYDQGVGKYILIKKFYANLHFVMDTLTPGVTYGFKVQSRNKFGLS